MAARWRTVAPAAWIFLLSRLVLAALATATAVAFGGSANPARFRWDGERLHELGVVVDVWARWDSDWYLRIAEHGYSWPSSTPAFFPLYPLLVGVVGRALVDHFVLAGVLVSLVAGLAAFIALFRLTEARAGRTAAAWTLALLAVFPTSLFLGAVYGESLFLLLAVGTFALVERGSLGRAGVVAGLAVLTRPAGIALLPSLALVAWRSDDRKRAFVACAPAAAIPLVYPLVLWAWLGRPLAFVDAQAIVWGRHLATAGPLGGVASAVEHGAVLDLAVAAGVVAGGIAAWRLLGAPYGLYTLVSVAIPLAFVADDDPLLSVQRFAVVVFPVFIVLGVLLERTRWRFAVAAALAAWAGVYVVRWSLWYWVA